ncbi:O-antigen ligase family protein [Phytohabitans kaempferiae]|uniref:O-antigen ligase family protein n=1 Tax=Phytohabitans kaempferiae TaxID=1620943 RepID=A0ABV6MFU7_9ACTN
MSTRKLVSASVANLLIPISGLVVGPILSRELGPSGRGLYAALTLPIVVCGWFGTYGLQDALTFHLRDGRLSRRAAARVSLLAVVPLGVLGIGLLAVLGFFVFGGTGHYGQFLTLALLAPLHVLANLFMGGLTGVSDIRGVNLVKVLPALLRTALVVFACLAFDLSAYWASVIFVASIAAGVIVGLLRLRRETAPDEADAAWDGRIPTRSLVTYSLAALPGVLAAISSARLDQIIGLPVIGAEQLGYYAVAVSVAEIPMVIATAARTVLMGRPSSDDPRRATRVARLAVVASFGACAFLAAIAAVAVPWVFGAPFTPAVLPTVILCAGTTLYTCMVIFSAVLLANGRAASSSAALVTGSVVSIVLLFLLAPMGAVGAAVASLAGYGVSVIGTAWALGKVPDSGSLRMLTVPGRDDVQAVRTRLAALSDTSIGRIVRRLGGIGFPTLAVGALIVLGWLRVVLPHVVQLFSGGRPEFNSRDDTVPALADRAGDASTLVFLAIAALLAVSGVWGRRPSHLPWLLVPIAPLVAIAISGAVNGQAPGIVTLALPLAALAIWLRPPRQEVLATFGALGAITAAGSILLALVRSDLALLSGADAGDKAVLFGGLLAGPYPHSNVLGISLALSLPFAFCLRYAALRWGSVAVMLVALFWTGSRSSQLAAAAVIGTYAAYRLVRRQPLRSWLLSVPIAGGVALVIFVPLVTTDPAGFTRRGQIWDALLDRWADRPMLGLGPEFLDRQQAQLAVEMGGSFNHAHNVLVQLIVAGGMVAAVLFAVLFAESWRWSMPLARAGMPAAALFLVAFCYVSWLEASHVSTTLAGYAAWLPLVLIARLGLRASESTSPTAGYAPVAPSTGEPDQKMTVSRM